MFSQSIISVTMLGYSNVLIGQIAVALRVPLYTFNQKHYRFIPGLQTIQPYDKTT